MHVHLNKNYVLLKNEHKVQNLHIKEMLSNAYKKNYPKLSSTH